MCRGVSTMLLRLVGILLNRLACDSPGKLTHENMPQCIMCIHSVEIQMHIHRSTQRGNTKLSLMIRVNTPPTSPHPRMKCTHTHTTLSNGFYWYPQCMHVIWMLSSSYEISGVPFNSDYLVKHLQCSSGQSVQF